MAAPSDNIPQAVATIVEKHGHLVTSSNAQPEENEAKIVAFTDKLYRAMLRAHVDWVTGKL